MRKVLCLHSIIAFTIQALFCLIFGCSEEHVSLPADHGPPEPSIKYKYDISEKETGFSKDLPMGHCLVFAGYNAETMEMHLSDPADNLQTGHRITATFKPHEVKFINGYCTTVIADRSATLSGAIVVKPPNRKRIQPPTRWTQYAMPDFSQHAIQPDWQLYCAPASAANLVSFFSDSYPELSPKRVFANDSDFNSDEEWLVNRLIAGNKRPFPKTGSFAYRMSTTPIGGTSYSNIAKGLKSFFNDHAKNPQEWEFDLLMENEQAPDGKFLWQKLISHCANGDGILLCVLWGVPSPSSKKGNNDGHSPVLSKSNSKNEHNRDSHSDENQEHASSMDSSVPSVKTTATNSAKTSKNSKINSNEEHETAQKHPTNTSVSKEQSNSVLTDSPPTKKKSPAHKALEPTILIIDDFDLEERGNLWFRTGNKTPFTGKAKRSYPSGNTLLEIPYLNGKKHGTQIIWEESGKVLRKIEWKNNQRSK
jgi:antitoxin component YwqK of YwqJK toxin-antitoxin module